MTTPTPSRASTDFLRMHGVIDPATIAAFRLDGVDDATLTRLRTAPGWKQRQRPFGLNGVNFPTGDPRQPNVILGAGRLSFTQGQHGFITSPVGIAGPTDLDRHERVVLVDSLLLALRLHQAGVRDVALVEDAVVLAPLLPWLASRREVILVSHKRAGLAAMASVLGDAVPVSQHILWPMSGDAFNAALNRWFKIGVCLVPKEPPPPITLLHLRDLHALSERMLGTRAGLARLREYGLDHSEVVKVYRFGFNPTDVRDALPDEVRCAFAGRSLGGMLVVPAIDEQGVVVDLMLAQGVEHNHVEATLWDAPRGLLAPTLATACEHLLVTDTLRRVGDLWRSGGPTLLLRGPADAQANAARIATGGVHSVEIHAHWGGEAIAEALRREGITAEVVGSGRRRTVVTQPESIPAAAVEPSEPSAPPTEPLEFPAQVVEVAAPVAAVAEDAASTAATPAPVQPSDLTPAPMLEEVSHDPRRERAEFRCGSLTIVLIGRMDPDAKLAVTVSVGDCRHKDSALILAAPAQRQRFTDSASAALGVPAAAIGAALTLLVPAMRKLAASRSQPTPARPVGMASAAGAPPTPLPMTPAERGAALALLRDPGVLEQAATDLITLGAGDDPDRAAVLALASVGRLATDPLWLRVVATEPAQAFAAIAALECITPPESVLRVSRLTDAALFAADPGSLRNRLVIVDDGAAITPAAVASLAVLRSRGSVSAPQVERDVLKGRMRTRVLSVDGPLALIVAGDPSRTLAAQLVDVDTGRAETPVHTGGVAASAPSSAQAPTHGDGATLTARWRNAQRLLVPKLVVIPEALRTCALPAIVARSRALRDAHRALVIASVLLNQHQRMEVDGALIATDRDLRVADALALGLATQQNGGLGLPARRLLAAWRATSLPSATMADLAVALPDTCRWSLRAGLDELIEVGLVEATPGGRGRTRAFRLAADAVATVASASATTAADPVRGPAPYGYDEGIVSAVGGLAGVGFFAPANLNREVVNG